MVIAINNVNVPLVGYPRLRSQTVTFLLFVVFLLEACLENGKIRVWMGLQKEVL